MQSGPVVTPYESNTPVCPSQYFGNISVKQIKDV